MPHVALGDNEALNYMNTLRILTQDLTKQEKTGALSFSHHRRKRSSGAQGEEARDIGLELVTRIRTWPTVQHTRAALYSGNDVLLAVLVRLPVPELLLPALEK